MIKIEENYFIKDRHTFHMPVYTKWFVEYETVEELVTLLQSDLLREHTFFPIGGGSNLLFVKEMYNGVLLHSAIQGMAVSEETDTEVLVEIGLRRLVGLFRLGGSREFVVYTGRSGSERYSKHRSLRRGGERYYP